MRPLKHRIQLLSLMMALSGCVLFRNEAMQEGYYTIQYTIKDEVDGKLNSPNAWWIGFFGRIKADPELSPKEADELIEYAKKTRARAGLPSIDQ